VEQAPYEFSLYTQGPSAKDEDPLASAADTARLAEQFGYTGVLLFYNHQSLDPWLLASALIQQTERLVPLVALQPYALPPMSAAKMVSTLADLYRRRVDINLIAGANPTELAQVGDETAHDSRYQRAIEYVQAFRALTSGDEAYSLDGRHYRYDRLSMYAAVEPELRPRIFVAGSSAAGREAAAAIADVAVTHPEPIDAFTGGFLQDVPGSVGLGIRIGVLARETAAEAWREARARHRAERAAVIETRLKLKSESEWSRRLAVLATEMDTVDDIYWTGAFASGKGSYPLLVGNYREVAGYLGKYLAAGVRDVLVAGLHTPDDFEHADRVFRLVRA
jgi:alkanesulfonate monooxygenase SsuD/methylene tetrahydromethanopterin reductase-like flavin-dependent oxidoreductase (luciferase family)